MGKIIGIDLGTTNSVVAVMEGDRPKVIANPQGARITPSVVAFTDDNPTGLVGVQAKNQSITNPQSTVYSIKRIMGRRANEISELEKVMPYEIVGSGEEPAKVHVNGKDYTPQEISAKVLQELKKAAESHLGEPVNAAVISVPAYFNDSQRQATKDAGRIAGLEVKRVFNEPTAASLAYGLDKKKEARIAVFDLGGGTFDISVLEVGDDVVEVLATNGDTMLGGDDFDRKITDYLADEFHRETGVDLRKDAVALQRLRDAAERAKCELSTTAQTDINLPYITADASGPKHLQMKLSRAKVEELCRDLLDRVEGPCRQAMKDSGLKTSDIDDVVLVGGMTRMPAVEAKAKELFGRDPHKGVNPDEVVAVGAAIQAGVLSGEVRDILLLDVTPLTLGIETLGGVMTPLIGRNTTIPTEKAEIFSTASDNQPAVDIHVLQGERKMSSDNRTLGRFQLTGIPPAPRGVPQIEVTFRIDANGILHVNAKDKGTGREQSISIKSSTGLSEDEIKKMVDEAESHGADDKKKGELVEAKNRSEQLLYATERTLKEHGDKVSAEAKGKIEKAIEELRKAGEGDDAAAINRAMENLATTSQELGKAIYENVAKEQAAAGAAGAGAGPGPQPGAEGAQEAKPKDEKVVDADFEVVDDKDK